MKKQLQKAGFTLIELIVVIAILGVLAGGAAVGYSGYVKKANKAADQQLVGSIERALDVGSYAFDIDPAVQISGDGLKLPVGFVVLTQEGAKGAGTTSTSEIKSAKPCEYVTYQKLIQENIIGAVVNERLDELNGTEVTIGSWGNFRDVTVLTQTAYASVPIPNGIVCKAHSNFNELTTDVYVVADSVNIDNTTEVKTAIANSQGIKVLNISTDAWFNAEYGLPNVIIQGTEADEFHKKEMEGSKATMVTPGELEETGTESMNASEVDNAMIAAFGTGWKNELRLKYDGWTAGDIASSMPSLYTGGASLFDTMKKIIEDTGFAPSADELNKNIGNNAKMLVGGFTEADIIYSDDNNSYKLKEDDIISAWEKISESGESDKIGGTPVWKTRGTYYTNKNGSDETIGNQNSSSAITAMLYNAGFTTWMQQSGKYTSGHIDGVIGKNNTQVEDSLEAHIDAILNWGDQTAGHANSGDGNDPYTICSGAFTDPNSKLPVQNCPVCQKAYKEYISSGAWKANASAAYNTLKTMADTTDAVQKAAKNGVIDDYLGYYKNYMEEFENQFGKVQEMANSTDGSCIIIAVYRTGSGAMDYDVYPAAADPRKS